VSHGAAVLLASVLAGFITGVAATAPVMWFLRDRIRARLARRRRG
jgi:hypothetical protein